MLLTNEDGFNGNEVVVFDRLNHHHNSKLSSLSSKNEFSYEANQYHFIRMIDKNFDLLWLYRFIKKYDREVQELLNFFHSVNHSVHFFFNVEMGNENKPESSYSCNQLRQVNSKKLAKKCKNRSYDVLNQSIIDSFIIQNNFEFIVSENDITLKIISSYSSVSFFKKNMPEEYIETIDVNEEKYQVAYLLYLFMLCNPQGYHTENIFLNQSVRIMIPEEAFNRFHLNINEIKATKKKIKWEDFFDEPYQQDIKKIESEIFKWIKNEIEKQEKIKLSSSQINAQDCSVKEIDQSKLEKYKYFSKYNISGKSKLLRKKSCKSKLLRKRSFKNKLIRKRSCKSKLPRKRSCKIKKEKATQKSAMCSMINNNVNRITKNVEHNSPQKRLSSSKINAQKFYVEKINHSQQDSNFIPSVSFLMLFHEKFFQFYFRLFIIKSYKYFFSQDTLNVKRTLIEKILLAIKGTQENAICSTTNNDLNCIEENNVNDKKKTVRQENLSQSKKNDFSIFPEYEGKLFHKVNLKINIIIKILSAIQNVFTVIAVNLLAGGCLLLHYFPKIIPLLPSFSIPLLFGINMVISFVEVGTAIFESKKNQQPLFQCVLKALLQLALLSLAFASFFVTSQIVIPFILSSLFNFKMCDHFMLTTQAFAQEEYKTFFKHLALTISYGTALGMLVASTFASNGWIVLSILLTSTLAAVFLKKVNDKTLRQTSENNPVPERSKNGIKNKNCFFKLHKNEAFIANIGTTKDCKKSY